MTHCKKNRHSLVGRGGSAFPVGWVASPLGTLTLWWGPDGLAALRFGEPEGPVRPLDQARPWLLWLDAYFAEPLGCGPPPPSIGRGTAFQRKVWRTLSELAPGQTLTYGALAQRLGTGPRALAGACRANPCPILVPCHRVVAAQGLGGYGGGPEAGRLYIKRWLLAHEAR